MMDVLIIILLILLFGAVAFMAINMMRKRDDGSQTAAMREYISGLDESNRRTIEAMRQSHSAELRMLTERHEEQVQALSRQWEARLQELDSHSRLAFQQLSRTALDGSVERLKASNGEMLDSVLDPLRQRLEALTELIHRVEVDSTSSRETLKQRIDMLAELNRAISDDARALTSALKGNSKVQGDWGETIMRSLLEKAGLEEGVNFRFQAGSDANGLSFRSDEGTLLRPDFIVDIPGDRHVIVDSKVSLTDYLKYCEADDPDTKSRCGKRHVLSVRRHIDELRDKKYQRSVPGALEHVLMFIPNEGAYLAAMRLDPDLWRYAYDHKVVMVTAPHLLTAIQIIAQMWRQERQDRNAAEIARVAGLLYDSFVTLNERMENVSRAIDNTRRTFDETRNMLNEGQAQSLTRRAMKLKEMGAKTHRSLPDEVS